MEDPFQPGFAFEDVKVSVRSSAVRDEWKPLLQGVSGYVHQGELLYVMGPSGAGKSTLLDAVNGCFDGGARVEGTQHLHGVPVTPEVLRQSVAYVPQEPAQFGALSVRDIFSFWATLRGDATVEESVLRVATSLGLERQLDTPYGDMWRRGLSTGQQRRVAIGAALLCKPKLLLLDEPTSGLDGTAAAHVMRYLKQIARAEQLPILCVIHQPTQPVFALADNVLLIADGRQAYFGPPHLFHAHVTRVLPGAHVPPRTSVAEWSLFLLTRQYWENNDKNNNNTINNSNNTGVDSAPLDALLQDWPASPLAAALRQRIACTRDSLSVAVRPAAAHRRRGGCVRDCAAPLWHVGARLVKLYVRDPSFIVFRAGLNLVLALFIALLAINIPDQSAQGVYNTVGIMASVIAFLPFLSLAVIPPFLQEFHIVTWEQKGGLYAYHTYLLAHSVVELVFLFALALACSLVVYFPIPLALGAPQFFTFVAALWLTLVASDSLMMVLALAARNFIVASAIACAAYGVFYSLQSFFIPVPTVGWYWQWLKFVDLLYYGFGIVVTNHFQNTSFAPSCDSAAACFPAGVRGDQVIAFYGLESRIWVGFVAIIAMACVMRGVALPLLHWRLTGRK